MPDGTSGPGTSEPGVIGSQLMGGVRAGVVSGGGPLPVPRSKFGCPAVPVRAIARPRLGEVLAQPDWRVALVTGGPATGKTVAVAQWFETLDPVAREWVTLDASDDRPERFWLTFVLALERAVPGAFAQAAAAAADGAPSAAGVPQPAADRVVGRHRSAGHRARRRASPAQPGDHRGSRLRRRAPSRTLEDAADQPGRPALAGQPVAGPGLARRGPPARSGADAARDRRAVHRARRAPSHRQ